MPRFAANLGWLFTDRPLLERFGAAARAGFKAVELQFPYAEPAAAVKAEIDRHGLTILGINTRATPESGLAAVPGREDDFAALFDEALAYARAIGARSIHCMSGTAPPDARAAATRSFVANLSRAADLAATHGITLLIEPINPRDRPDYVLSRAEQAAEIIAAVNRPNVRMQFDFYHAQIVGGDLLRRFETHLPMIGHVQIAAVPSRAEPDEGEVNYPAILPPSTRLVMPAGSAANTGRAGRPKRVWAGARPMAWARADEYPDIHLC